MQKEKTEVESEITTRFEPGTIIDGKYKILDIAGEGGMSIVYRAVVESSGKIWAVKVVRRDGRNDYNTVKQNLISEIKTLKSINHSKLPKIADIIQNDADDSYIIIMDYIEGRSLDVILKDKGAQPEKAVISWAMQLCEILAYLHSKNIIYRDMKPANVMLKPSADHEKYPYGEVTIIDFGTAKEYVINSGETTGLGTAGFAAPEQYRGSGKGRTDARTDIYTLGMTMYSLLTKVDPKTEYIGNRSVRLKNPSLTEEIDQIILKCTADDMDARYQSCAELIYDLNNIELVGENKKKKAIRKIVAFSASLILSFGFAVSGFVMNSQAKSKAIDNYTQIISDAAQTSDTNEKIRLYKQAIEIPEKAGDSRAYLGLIQTYKTNDGETAIFTDDEVNEIEKLIISNRTELMSKENQDGYIEICYEMGKMFWYYYDDKNQVSRAKYAVEWFQSVVDGAPADYENFGLATVYMNIGIFYRDITTRANETSDKGMYSSVFYNIKTLMNTIADNQNENDIVRLELLEMARNLLHQYPTKLKKDGIKKESLMKIYNQIEENLDTIIVPDDEEDKSYTMKNSIYEKMSDTKAAIEIAYGTDKGGDS